MRHAAALALLIAASAPAARAQAPADLLRLETKLIEDSAGGRGTLRLEGALASGWHVNSHEPSEDYLIATAVQPDPSSGVTFGEPLYPDGMMRKFAFSESPLSVYEGRFVIDVPVRWTDPSPPAISGALEYQACNDRQCLPPASARFRVAGSGTAAPAGSSPDLPGGAMPLSEAPKNATTSTAAAGASGDFGKSVAERGYFLVLLSVFLGGLALNLTPCVYPVIPLTVGYFGGQAAGSRRRVLALASAYVLGIVIMYSGVGVAAALSGKLFGALLQSRWVLGGIAAIMLAMALSMFGLYELRVPSSWMQKAGARAGLAGALGMGLLVGIVASPCLAPFTLGLLAFVAERGSVSLGALFFSVLSLGLGLPYLFLAVFSGSLARLPRAGGWMEGVKKVFGWLLLAMAAYFLRLVLPRPWGEWILPVTLVAGAVALVVKGFGLGRVARFATAVLFLAAAAFFVPRQALGWQPYEESRVKAAARPAVIDFTADWCLPCLELDQRTFSDQRVRKELATRALFKADLTRGGSPQALALTKKYQILGVPTVIFLDAAGKERTDLRLVGYEGPEKFLERLALAP